MNWITLKSEVEADIKEASITNKKAIAARNKLENGASWEAATWSQAYWDAQDILEDKFQEGEFQNEWKAYCDQLGTLGRASMGDHLC